MTLNYHFVFVVYSCQHLTSQHQQLLSAIFIVSTDLHCITFTSVLICINLTFFIFQCFIDEAHKSFPLLISIFSFSSWSFLLLSLKKYLSFVICSLFSCLFFLYFLIHLNDCFLPSIFVCSITRASTLVSWE